MVIAFISNAVRIAKVVTAVSMPRLLIQVL